VRVPELQGDLQGYDSCRRKFSQRLSSNWPMRMSSP
jgi:hypothetical protein